MAFQYILEGANNIRINVTENSWRMDRMDRRYKQVHAYGNVIIYQMV